MPFRDLIILILHLSDETIISKRKLRNYETMEERWKEFKFLAVKTKYLYNILKPLLDQIEMQNIGCIVKYLEGSQQFRNVFLDIK